MGDLVNRGPASPDVLRLAMSMVLSANAACVQGNHDLTLLEALRVRGVVPPTGEPGPLPAPGAVEEALSHGLAESLEQLEGEPSEFLAQVAGFLEGLASHLVLDGGDLVVAHDGAPPELGGQVPPGTVVVYGHTPVAERDMGGPEHLHRYRLRLWGQADGLALPRAGTGQRGRPQNLLGAGPPSPPSLVI